ncbi:hypothetical protein FXB41_11360 [Bradyrhizobium canariense]|uniref:hypothetical protein n=1 Tax=Bradyrhizobium canariense TaxID=255045 RepID=UPI001CA5D344|nr:hypothetical protein [Bradyrhizobium canariense]MBW5435355.1 hypothetical protein [Bradyrhizobium canariense]
MNKRLRQRYQTANERAEAAEAEVQRASESRLAELMELPPARRLNAIDDPLLTRDDRLKLRNSIEAKLKNRSSRRSIKLPSTWSLRRMRGLLRHAPALAIAIVFIFPAGALTYTAWKNTYEVVALSRPFAPLWTLPNGTQERKEMPAGGNLAIKRLTGTSAIARRWIEGAGYATYETTVQ